MMGSQQESRLMQASTACTWCVTDIKSFCRQVYTDKVCHKTGAGTTMSRLGMPDLGVATLNDMRDNAAMISSLDPTVPVIADADTGFGGKRQRPT